MVGFDRVFLQQRARLCMHLDDLMQLDVKVLLF
jgi:hypothetical protein